MLTIETRPSRPVEGSNVSNWIAAANPVIFGFYNDAYVPDPAYQIIISVYESGTDKLLGKLKVRPFSNGRVKVDVSGVLRGYLSNENTFAYDGEVNNQTSAKSSIKFYIVYQEIVVDASQVAFSGYANVDGHTRLVGTAPKATEYHLHDNTYLYYNDGTSDGPYEVIGFETASSDVVLDRAYIDAGKPGKLSLLPPEEKFVTVSDIANSYFATLSAKQPGDRYGQNMGEYVPFQVEDLPLKNRAKWLTSFDTPVFWPTWPFAVDFIYSESLKGISIYRVEAELDQNETVLVAPHSTATLDPTQVETVNRLTLLGGYGDEVGFVGLELRTGSPYIQELYVAPGYVLEGYVEVL